MERKHRMIAGLVMMWGCHASLQAQPDYPTELEALRAATPPVIDGRLDDAVWDRPAQVTELHQLDPGEYDPPSQRTEIWLSYDADNLYIAARMHDDDPQRIVANNLMQQQRVTPDDRFIVVLDTFSDRRNGYFLEVNPHGQRGDALLENNSRMLEDWDGIWVAAATIDAGGWNAELRIPFKTLSFDPDSDSWGINFFRDLPDRQEFLAWSSQGRQDWNIAPRYAGRVHGLSGLEQGRGLDIVPSASLVYRDDRTGAPDGFEAEPSVDLFYKFTPQLTGALTLNTDFSATEVDDRQMNMGRFALFFPEKRDFFLQDAGIFEFGGLDTNGRPFFSRRIGLGSDGSAVDMQAGVKLTGRTDGWGVGALAVQQGGAAAQEDATLLVTRLKRDVGESGYLGGIVTWGDPTGTRDAHTVGLDTRYQRTVNDDGRQFIASGWAQRSHRAGVDDSAWGGNLQLTDDRYNVDYKMERFGADFDPALGFVNRTGIQRHRMFLRARQRPEDHAWLRTTYQWAYLNFVNDLDGRLESREMNFSPLSASTHRGERFELWYSDQREVLDSGFDLFGQVPIAAGDHRFHRIGYWGRTGSQRDLSLESWGSVGDFYDGYRRDATVRLTWRPGPRFSGQARVTVFSFENPAGRFTSRLFSLRANVALDAQWSWITLAQYDNVSGRLGLNTRLRWIPEPGQEYFLVLDHGALDTDRGFRTQHDEVVLKLSYTFRF